MFEGSPCVGVLTDILLIVGDGVGIGAGSHQRSVCASADGDGVGTGAGSHQSSGVLGFGLSGVGRVCLVCGGGTIILSYIEQDMIGIRNFDLPSVRSHMIIIN